MRFFKAIAAAVFALALVGCGGDGAQNGKGGAGGDKNGAGGATAAKVLKVGTNAEFPPFEFVDDKNQITGFDIELLAEFSRRSGIAVEVVNMNFDAIIPALKFGKIDAAISGMSATPQRREAVDFSEPYYATENLFLRRKGDTRLRTRADIAGKKLAVLLGSVQELAGKGVEGAILLPADSVTANIQALKAGRADAVIIDSSIGYGFLRQNADLEAFLVEPDGSDGFAVAFDKGKHAGVVLEFNKQLEAMKKDGTYEKLLKKYELN